MIRRRRSPDGLPFRVYRRCGARVLTYTYKHRDGTNQILSSALLVDKVACTEARRIAMRRGAELNDGAVPDNTVAELFNEYFAWQRGLPPIDERKKAQSTIEENEREAKPLLKVFGAMAPDDISAPDLYQFQDLRVQAGAGPKANKELALMSAVLEYGRARGRVRENVARGIKRIPTRPATRCVTWAELQLVRNVAQESPAWTIQALAACAAWLCVRRPPEILALQRSRIEPGGVRFLAAKRKAGEAERTVLIEWSPAMREVFDTVLAVKRHKVAGAFYVFGNLAGQRYTKSGWGAMWRRLMARCKERIENFESFTLQDCRPGGVTAKRSRGDQDTQDATMHTDARMIDTVYDRRRDRKAKPAG